MKRVLTIVALIAIFGQAQAQNLQLHYDSRGWIDGADASSNIMTGTFEFLKNDRLGSTFMFVDFDFHFNSDAIGLIYAEISRSFRIGKCPIQPHIEYNGGILKGMTIPNAYLAGGAYELPVGAFFLKTYLAYKLNQFHSVSHDAQWTAVWDGTLLDGRLTISGFLDVWTQNKDHEKGGGGKQFVLLTEPQFWYNVVRNKFAVGTEVEMSTNFYSNVFKCYPTLAVKYNF